MYAGDHSPPHFHVRLSDGREALVIIESFGIISSSLKSGELAPALEWATANKVALIARWQELNP